MGEFAEDFAGDGSFEASHDVFFGEAFGGASGDVGAGWFVAFHADDDDAVQRGVGLPVAAAVEAMPVGFARLLLLNRSLPGILD